eukprot:c23664_g1_i1 orf=426-1868(+)
MKASLKFREEKNPLLRAKLPFNVGAVPLSSGVAVGCSQELAIHLGTFFAAGPAIKLAFKPNDLSPFSVILKTGLGLWGSPNGAPISLRAEFSVASKGGNPLFTLRVKPRVGDFSIQKDVKSIKFAPAQQKASETAMAPLQSNALTDKLAVASTPPPTNGDAKAFPKRNGNSFSDKDRLRSPSLDSNAVVIGSNFSLKIEGLDREWKGRNDKKQKAEGMKDQESEGDVTADGNGSVARMSSDLSNEQVKPDGSGRVSAAFSSVGAHINLQGCRIVAHSILPFGKHARFNIRWGVKPHPDIFEGWDGSVRLLSLSKLPSLLLDKISFEQVSAPAAGKLKAPALQSGYLEGAYFPASFSEENRELAQVASLCYNMKRQLHLLYAENQVLRRSMEDMKSQVELRGFRSGSDDGVLSKEQVFARPTSPLLDGPRSREEESRKGYRDMTRKDADMDAKAMPSMTGANPDRSKELEKAIKSAKNGSN